LLTHIDVDSENAFVVPILGVSPKEPILVRSISGLNPPDVDLFIGDYARDGGLYTGRRVGKRNVVIIFDLNPNPALGQTISGLRDLLYKAFMDPRPEADYIKLTFHDDLGRARYVVGYVEKFETDIFSSGTMVQISIICPDPYIRDEESTILSNSPGWVTVDPFSYPGTAETGLETEIYITSLAPPGVLTFDVNGYLLVLEKDDGIPIDHVVYINTNRGYRKVMMAPLDSVQSTTEPEAGAGSYSAMNITSRWEALEENEETTSLVAYLTPDAVWPELHSQNNLVKVYGATTSSTPAVVRNLQFTPTYWGV
jgi:hypothetical protein